MQPDSFVLSSSTILTRLITSVHVERASDPSRRDQPAIIVETMPYKALWDTGASRTFLSPQVVADCRLNSLPLPPGETNENKRYETNVLLAGGKQSCRIEAKSMPLGLDEPDVNVIIGMDIIRKGDFALTHLDGKGCFSFSEPSTQQIPFYDAPGSSFTTRVDGLPPELLTPISLGDAFDPLRHPAPVLGLMQGAKPSFGLWDTGAPESFIHPRLIDRFHLRPAHGLGHLLSIGFSNKVWIPNVCVRTRSDLPQRFDMLIGMDIIRKGDFVVTHPGGDTWVSFRIPSNGGIDFSAPSESRLQL